MAQYHVSESRIINASPETIYAILSDYHEGHPSILPQPYFKSLEVEEGGVGANTVLRVAMEVYGNKREFRLRVSEPEPGRVLMEEDPDAGTVTRFTLDPMADGRTRVTIASDFRAAGGLRGWLERLMNPAITRRIYEAELELLDQAASRREQG
jgi:hypothetical protein